MKTLLYSDLTPFYRLLDPLEDHADEGEAFGELFESATDVRSALLELGAGAGNGAYYLKSRFDRAVLTDLSPSMLGLSERINGDCDHRVGDMRTLRLGQTFDCVLVHDAISYLTSEDDLAACFTTAYEHLRPGGAALFVPDCTKESFCEWHEDHAGDDGLRSLRALSWSHDPDPSDDTHLVEFAFLLRENGEVRAVHDTHLCGLFAEDTWGARLRGAGFNVRPVARPLPEEYARSPFTERMFLATRPPHT
ncbi:MAG: class I SAM-dependent methyltransferase [Myxococcota bacterium]